MKQQRVAWPEGMVDAPLRHAALVDLLGLVGHDCVVTDDDGVVMFAGGTAVERLGTDPSGRRLDGIARRGDTTTLVITGDSHRLERQHDEARRLSVHEITGIVAGHPVAVLAIGDEIHDRPAPAFDAKDTTDPLTGLPNRNRFLDELTQQLAAGCDVAVLLVDLDRFHLVNEQVGHDAGDQLLKVVAERIAAAAGADTLVARLTGDEFVLLSSNDDDIADPVGVAQRIAAALAEPLPGVSEPMTASIGIAQSLVTAGPQVTRREVASTLLNNADAALYRAKELGRGRIEVFTAVGERSRGGRYDIEMSLRGALERGELELAYQPVIAIATGQADGAEALLRWRRSGIVVPPDQFISVAEQTGLIVPIGRWVATKAAETLADWDQRWPQNPLTMSINVSARQLDERDIVEQLVSSVVEAGMSPERFKLEITESVLLGDAEEALGVLRALRDAGFSLAMDDFGTGYSSLTYLRKFPVDTVKIDKSFVAPVNESNDDSTIVSMIVALAHALGLGIVAEGVESFEQAATLYALRCQHGQGFYWSRPLSPTAAVDWFERSFVADSAVSV